MSRPFPPRTVPATKLTRYLLDPMHEVGSSKEAFFRAYGFSADRWEVMAAALMSHPDRNPIEKTTSDQWGTRHVVRCTVGTPDRRDPCIRSVWIVPKGHDTARLVTAYPG